MAGFGVGLKRDTTMTSPMCKVCFTHAYNITVKSKMSANNGAKLTEAERYEAYRHAARMVRKRQTLCREHDIQFLATLDRPFTVGEAKRANKYLLEETEKRKHRP